MSPPSARPWLGVGAALSALPAAGGCFCAALVLAVVADSDPGAVYEQHRWLGAIVAASAVCAFVAMMGWATLRHGGLPAPVLLIALALCGAPFLLPRGLFLPAAAFAVAGCAALATAGLQHPPGNPDGTRLLTGALAGAAVVLAISQAIGVAATGATRPRERACSPTLPTLCRAPPPRRSARNAPRPGTSRGARSAPRRRDEACAGRGPALVELKPSRRPRPEPPARRARRSRRSPPPRPPPLPSPTRRRGRRARLRPRLLRRARRQGLRRRVADALAPSPAGVRRLRRAGARATRAPSPTRRQGSPSPLRSPARPSGSRSGRGIAARAGGSPSAASR